MKKTEEHNLYMLFVEDEPYTVSLTQSQIRLLDWLINEHFFNELLKYEKLDDKPPIVIWGK